MSKMELDDGILDHPKFVKAIQLAGADAWLLWCGLRSYCSKQLTDGFVPGHMLTEVRGPKNCKRFGNALKALLTVGLLENSEGGVRLHDYLDWSSSREQVLAWRRANTERKRKSRAASQRDIGVTGEMSHRDTAVSHTGCHGGSHAGIPEPSPSPSQISDLKIHPNPPLQAGLSAISNLGPFGDADEMHDAIEKHLLAVGFEVEREVWVDDRGDGRRGRLDLVARYTGGSIAVELDRGAPREKSVRKLRGYNGLKCIVLRETERFPKPEGIDFLFCVKQLQSGQKPADPLRATFKTQCPDRFDFTEAHRGLAKRGSIDIGLEWRGFSRKAQSSTRHLTDWGAAFEAHLAECVQRIERAAAYRATDRNTQRGPVLAAVASDPGDPATPAAPPISQARPVANPEGSRKLRSLLGGIG